MSADSASLTWLDANQRLISAEFGRIEALLGQAANGDVEDAVRTAEKAIAEARSSLPDGSALDTICESFDLTSFERDVLLLGAGVEMHSGISRACARANGGHERNFATFGLALAALPGAHWSALSPTAPLRRWHLIEPRESLPFMTSALRLDERICHALVGVNALDRRLEPMIRPRATGALVAEAHQAAAERIASALTDPRDARRIVQLHGNDPDGQADVAVLAAARLGMSLYAVRADAVPAAPSDRLAFATLWSREAVLLGSALLVEAQGSGNVGEDFLDQLPPPVFVAAREPIATRSACLHVAVDRPDARERARLWQIALDPTADPASERFDVVASQFSISARAIALAGSAARRAGEDGGDPAATVAELCRIQARTALEDLAQRIEPRAHWDELVVPDDVAQTLREIISQVQHRITVYDVWGFGARGARGLGITALFTGESGTGKSMAAEVLAKELDLDVYRIDLSTVISKYIGETEKNLRRVFDAADASGAILLFDESDALFGKRSDVRDSHDRYANIEVSYLLQRMDAYAGLAILTTNMKTSLDRAFQRRLRFIVQFPFPDVAQRERIWRNVFPAAVPIADLDFPRLARISVAGGGVRNIAVNAAFLAARDGGTVTMPLLLEAARAEFRKLNRPFNESEFR